MCDEEKNIGQINDDALNAVSGGIARPGEMQTSNLILSAEEKRRLMSGQATDGLVHESGASLIPDNLKSQSQTNLPNLGDAPGFTGGTGNL